MASVESDGTLRCAGSKAQIISQVGARKVLWRHLANKLPLLMRAALIYAHARTILSQSADYDRATASPANSYMNFGELRMVQSARTQDHLVAMSTLFSLCIKYQTT